MSSLSNISNANEAQFGRFGTFNLSSSNPFYSTSLDYTVVTDITADTSGNITYTLDGSPDLSEVIVGSYVEVRGDQDNAANNGIKQITAVNDGSDTITVSNLGRNGVTDASPENVLLSVRGLTTVGIKVQADLTITTLELNDTIGTPATTGYTAGYSNELDISKLAVSGGTAIIAIGPDVKLPNQG